MFRFSSFLCDTKRSCLSTIIGLVGIVLLLSLPFVQFTGEGDEMPQLMRFIGHFHPVLLHLPIGVFILIFFPGVGHDARRAQAAVGQRHWVSADV